jgi:HlyD family secretion protein
MKSKKVLILVVGIVLVLFVSWKFLFTTANGKIYLETAKPSQNTLSTVVTATGTIEPITEVEVGTQVSGKIEKIYVDFNSHVKKNQLLAEIDQTILQSTLKNAETALQGAKTEAEYQEKNYKRVKALYEKNFSSQTDLELSKYNYDNATNSYEKAKLTYEMAKQNLSYAFIYSPIDGVILNVAIKEGQTVAASFSTPTIFTIANDLTRMQVEANVDEADIGQVKVGQQVTFTVDAFSSEKFAGTVSQVRLNPTTSSNVVTYTVIIEAPNPENKLMPGMTASITVTTQKEENVMTVPTTATRFSPETDLAVVAGADKQYTIKPLPNNQLTGSEKIVWVKNGNELKAKKIITGLSDGINVQVLSGLDKNDEVIIGVADETIAAKTDTKASGQESPFMPKPPGSGKKK